MFQQAGRALLVVGEELSEYFLGGRWRWGFDIVIFLFSQIQLWTTIWTWRTFAPKRKHVQEDKANEVEAQSKGEEQTTVSETSPKLFGIADPLAPHSSSICLADFPLEEGVGSHMIASGCELKADFISPLFGREKLAYRHQSANGASTAHRENQHGVFPLRQKHRGDMQQLRNRVNAQFQDAKR